MTSRERQLVCAALHFIRTKRRVWTDPKPKPKRARSIRALAVGFLLDGAPISQASFAPGSFYRAVINEAAKQEVERLRLFERSTPISGTLTLKGSYDAPFERLKSITAGCGKPVENHQNPVENPPDPVENPVENGGGEN